MYYSSVLKCHRIHPGVIKIKCDCLYVNAAKHEQVYMMPYMVLLTCQGAKNVFLLVKHECSTM